MSEKHTSSSTNESQARITIPLPAFSLEDSTSPSHNGHLCDEQYHNVSHASILDDAIEENDDVLTDEDEEFLEPTVKIPTLRSTTQPQNAVHLANTTTTTTPLPAMPISDIPDTLVDEDQQAPTQKMPALTRPLPSLTDSSLPTLESGLDESVPTGVYATILQISELDVDNVDMEINIPVGTDVSHPLADGAISTPESFDDFSELDIDGVAIALVAITRKLPIMLSAKLIEIEVVQEELVNEAQETTAEVDETAAIPISTDDVRIEEEQGTITPIGTDDETILPVTTTTDSVANTENTEIEIVPVEDTLPDQVEIVQEDDVEIDDILIQDGVEADAFENNDDGDSIVENSAAVAVLTEDVEEEQPTPVMETPRPTWDEAQQLPPVTPVPSVYLEPDNAQQGRGRYYRRLARAYWRSLFSSILIIVLLLNGLLLWQNVNSPHLLLGVLNAASGTITAQQDLGSVSPDALLTNPLYGSSKALIGIHTATAGGTQEVLALHGSGTSWQQSTLHVPQNANSLSMTQDGHLLLENTRGMQVITTTGQQAWQIQGAQPARGEHLFQPASDAQTIYSVQSANTGKIAAYNMQNGQVRWTHTLNDTLNYAPPFLLNGNTLYIASDHALYALNKIDGTQSWQVPYVARTLLVFNTTLIAVGPQGLTAFDTTTGQVAWSFSGQMSNRLTPPQLYQATLANANHTQPAIIYTTGVVWQIPEAREQLWLYAVNASNGQMLWTHEVATGFVSADAGRTLIPLTDSNDGLVMLQQQINANAQRISAFSATSGSPRWQINLPNSMRSAPTLLKTADGSSLYFTTTTGVSLFLHTFSLARTLFLLCILLSIVGLALLWGLPHEQGRQRLQYALKLISISNHVVQQRTMVGIQQLRRWHPTPAQILAIALPLLACTSTLLYLLFNSPQTRIALVNTATGNQQWVHAVANTAQPLGTNGKFSVIETSASEHMQQIEVLNTAGTVLWHSFASEGQFSVPVLSANAQTLLVALHGPTTLPYQYAPADPAYPPATHDMLAFYQFDSSNGHVLWNHIATYPGLGQNVSILGTDSNYIYVVGIPVSSAPAANNLVAAQLQLFAVNQRTGNVDWHVFGPSVTPNTARYAGSLLFNKRQVIWQIDGNVYAIDPLMGQIEWRHALTLNNATTTQHEEQQMVLTPNALLVTNHNDIYALDIISGNLLWSLPIQAAQPITLAANDQIMVVATGNTIRAYALSNQHQLWQQQAGIVQKLLADSQNVYVLAINGTTSEVTAMHLRNGAVQWTQTMVGSSVLAHSNFLLSHNSLFIGLCQSTDCTNTQLALLQSASGTVRWQITAQQMNNVLFSQDETQLLFDEVGTNAVHPGL